MDTTEDSSTAESQNFLEQHRFLILIILSIVISLFLVVISMSLYNSSGAAQLDLSRPGYKSVVSQAVDYDNSFQAYPATGTIDANAINSFKTLYSKQATNTKVVDAFGGDPLNPDALGISAPQN
jgi:hypothetical protein